VKARRAPRRASTARVRVAADEDGLARIFDVYDRFVHVHEIPDDIRRDVYVALEEIVSNVFRHGTHKRTPHVSVRLAIEGPTFELQIVDDGPLFDPFSAAPPDTSAPLLERQEGGLGILFVARLTDEHSYVRRGNRNRVTLRRSLRA
jgi:anti-sigma regulatory factor (Ser/Thr protein kinase)